MSYFLGRCGAALLGVYLASATAIALGNQFVRLDYNLTIEPRSRKTVFIELFDDRPLTVDNFLQYVNGGLYDTSIMHRLSKDFVLQGGGFYPVLVPEPEPVYVSLDPTARVDLDGNPSTANPTVNNEYGNSPTRSNVRGTLAMARIGGQPNSATNQWFFNLENNTFLDTVDGGFTVFGRVVGDGMALLDVYNDLLTIINLNPDTNNDGIRDNNNYPFYNPAAEPFTDGVPVILNQTTSEFRMLFLNRAQQIDYLGSGSVTNVPSGGLAFASRDAFIDSGATFSGTGELIVGVGRTLGIRENLQITRPLVNEGTVQPGLQIGAVNIPAYLQSATGALDIQLRGTTFGNQYDSLFVIGQAQIDGKLDISLINQYMPSHGHSFTVLSAAQIDGEFATIDLPLLAPGLVWNVSETSSAITLSVTKTDFNHDGVANLADYVLWRDMAGRTGEDLAADANGDMVIDTVDLAYLHSSFGGIRGNVAAGTGSVAAVPEPSAVALVAMAFVAAMGRSFSRSAPRTARRG